MANWLTTHYPHCEPDDVEWDIFECGRSPHFGSIKPGDRVAFFVYSEGPQLAGARKRSSSKPGIVKVGRAASLLINKPYHEELANGKILKFDRRVICEKFRDGFIPRNKVNGILGYKSNAKRYPTIKPIDDEQFDRIVENFGDRKE